MKEGPILIVEDDPNIPPMLELLIQYNQPKQTVEIICARRRGEEAKNKAIERLQNGSKPIPRTIIIDGLDGHHLPVIDAARAAGVHKIIVYSSMPERDPTQKDVTFIQKGTCMKDVLATIVS